MGRTQQPSAEDQMAEYDRYVANRPAVRQKEKGLSCSGRCARNTLIVMNLVFMLLGATIIGIGVLVLRSDVSQITSKNLAVGLIAIGAIILLTACLGGCGAVRESRSMLCVYATILFLIILAQIILGALVLSDKDRADKLIDDGWESADADTKCDLMNQFDCCGLDGGSSSTFSGDTACSANCATTSPNYSVACRQRLKDKLEENFNLLGMIAVFFAIFQVVGVCMSMYLRRATVTSHEFEEPERVNRNFD